MARPQAQIDLCHVATPGLVIERLRDSLDIQPGVVALDPCCGDGSALAALNPRGRNFGIELDRGRAVQARKTLSSVLACSMQDARVSNNAFGLLLLNPPYDASTDGRLETVFLNRCGRYLMPGGILILLIKETMFGCVTRRLMREYEPLGHWRFPDPFYDGPDLSFGQTCLIARKLAVPSCLTDPRAYATHALNIGSLEPLPDEFTLLDSVPIGNMPRIFMPGTLSESDLIKLIETSPLGRQMPKPPKARCGAPPLPLKLGHISLALASGMIDGVYGDGETLHIAKGVVVRDQTENIETDQTAAGNPVMIKTTIDSFRIVIRAMLASGDIVEMRTDVHEDAAT